MIKQNWNIDSEEVKRILMMHENATKNLYLINEQQKVKVGEKTTTTGKEIALDKKSYPAGLYSIGKLGEGKKDLDLKLQEIAQFAKENNGTQLNIQIEVGESKVTNFDNELKKPLGQGELARLRGEKLQQYLTSYFQGLVKSGYLETMPNIPQAQTNVELGTQKYEYVKGKDNPKDVKYLEDQYVKFKITLSATKTEDVYGCLVDLTIDVSYYDKKDEQFPCRGGHECNNAKFEVFLDSVSLGIANLNNDGCERQLSKNPNACDRTAKLIVTNEMVQKIISNPKWNQKTLILSTRCLSSANCHTSIQEVRIVNGEGTEVYHGCVNPQSARGNTAQKILAVLDKCGKPIEGSIDDNVSEEEAQALSDEVKSQDTAKVEEQKRKFKETLNTEGVYVNPGSSFNATLAPSNFYEISNITLNGEYVTGIFTVKKDFWLGNVKNPLGDGKNGRVQMKKGETFKVSFQSIPLNIREGKLNKLVSDGTIYKIPNLNGYFVYRPFEYNGTNYYDKIVILPTTEQ
jgi:hypothetical protein